MKWIWLASVLMALVIGGGAALAAGQSKSFRTAPQPSFDPKLPVFGARLAALPAGPGREIAAKACLSCHSSDILRQQRLTEAQWAASVKKMIGWGADVPGGKKGRPGEVPGISFRTRQRPLPARGDAANRPLDREVGDEGPQLTAALQKEHLREKLHRN